MIEASRLSFLFEWMERRSSGHALYGGGPRTDEGACAIRDRDLSYAPLIRDASGSVLMVKGKERAKR